MSNKYVHPPLLPSFHAPDLTTKNRTHHPHPTRPKPTKTPAPTTLPPPAAPKITTANPTNHTRRNKATINNRSRGTAHRASRGCIISSNSRDRRDRRGIIMGGGPARALGLEGGFVRGCWARWLVVVVWTSCFRGVVGDGVGGVSSCWSWVRSCW